MTGTSAIDSGRRPAVPPAYADIAAWRTWREDAALRPAPLLGRPPTPFSMWRDGL